MFTFRTEITPSLSPIKINYYSKVLNIGSCFAENIGKYLSDYKFNVLINPFGILYNPISISNCVNFLINKKEFEEEELFFFNEKWNSFYHHGSFSLADKSDCLDIINNSVISGHYFLKSANVLLVTLGSAYVYKHLKKDIIVSNCHKIPEREFIQYLLEPEFIISELTHMIKKLKVFNPEINIIFTVSPIRYLKYGFEYNQLSKSSLIFSIHQLIKRFDFIKYFPSYEIMLDDLRDYRFYDSDMIHPNETAIRYIWNKFQEVFLEKETLLILKDIEKISLAKKHIPKYPGSDNHKNFIKKQIVQINELLKKYPFLDFKEEMVHFEKQLFTSS